MAITAEQKNDLVEVYIGYFNRAPDPEGFQFYIDAIEAGNTVASVAETFSASPEAKALYPFLTTPDVSTPATFIQSVYQNLFNRAADSDGLAFWSAQISSGAVSPTQAILAIINGAQAGGTDRAILDNKVDVGLDFVTDASDLQGFIFDDAAKTAATTAIAGVDGTAATVTAAKAATDTFLATTANTVDGDTFTLTTTVGEDIDGGAGNDTFSATADAAGLGAAPQATLNPTDSIDGGAGTDTANITATSAAAVVPVGTIQNVEIVNLISDIPADDFNDGAAGTTNLNVANFAGVQQLWQIGATAPDAVAGVTDAVTVGFNATAALADLQMATGATTANIALVNVATAGTINIGETTAGTLTTANVTGSTAAGGTVTLNLDAAAATGGAAASAETTVNVGLTSASTVVITSASATTNDFSGSTGAITSVGSAAATTVKGGSGNDNFVTAAATVTSLEGGAGNDVLNAAASTGAVTIDGGTGNDVITAGGAGSTITGGAGFDNMAAGGGVDTFIINAGDSTLTFATIDQITGFKTAGADKIDFNLAAGTATNFLSDGSSTGFVDGLSNANTAMNGTIQYFVATGIADVDPATAGAQAGELLFVDSDLDGTADFAVAVQGTALVFGDIIA